MSGTPTFTPGGVPDGVRRRTPASTRLLHEWSILQPWVTPPQYELRLGPTPLSAAQPSLTPEILALLRNSNRYADLVGITAKEIQVVEAKMIADPGAVSQVLHYRDLVYATPLLRQYTSRVVQPVLLWAVDDAIVHQTAVRQGIRVIVFTPAWVNEYLQRSFLRGRRSLAS
jgi:hypothetical protein